MRNNKGSGKHFHTSSSGYRSKTYKSWGCMIERCYGHDPDKQKNYRDKGIKVCERWLGEHGFENFLADMGERPEGMTLDRYPNQNGNYEPGNCRWATAKQQTRNLSTNLIVRYKGEDRVLSDWLETLGLAAKGLKRTTVWDRIKRGLTPEIAFTEPPRSKKIYEIKKQNLEAKKTA